jgi:hypothetical protein
LSVEAACLDEARRIAANVAKLQGRLGRKARDGQ